MDHDHTDSNGHIYELNLLELAQTHDESNATI